MPGLRKLVPEDLCGKPRRFRSGEGSAPAVTQAINYMIQSQPSAIPMGRIHRLYGENKKIVKEGDIRKDTITGWMVECRKFLYEEETGPDGRYIAWLVKDVLSGETYKLKESRLSVETYCEMEVIAWAATQ